MLFAQSKAASKAAWLPQQDLLVITSPAIYTCRLTSSRSLEESLQPSVLHFPQLQQRKQNYTWLAYFPVAPRAKSGGGDIRILLKSPDSGISYAGINPTCTTYWLHSLEQAAHPWNQLLFLHLQHESNKEEPWPPKTARRIQQNDVYEVLRRAHGTQHCKSCY